MCVMQKGEYLGGADMQEQRTKEIIDMYHMLGIEDVESVQNTFSFGEIEGRNLCKIDIIEEEENAINYATSIK